MSPEKPLPPQYLRLRPSAYEGFKGTKVVKSMTNEKYNELAKEADKKIKAANQEYTENYRRLPKLY